MNEITILSPNRLPTTVEPGGTVVEHHVKIGNGARIHSNAFIPEYSVLEQECWIGPGVILTDARYPSSIDVKETLKGPYVGEKTKSGAGTVLLPGITIGPNALVGAGSVVVMNVLAEAVVVGNPARVIKSVTDIESYRLLTLP